MGELAHGIPLSDIVLAEIVTDEDTPKTHKFKTASECKLSPKISKGKEKYLRIKDTIHSQTKTKDICIGMDITLKDNVFTPEVFALIDGGTNTYDETDPQNPIFKKYTAPVTGQNVQRTLFALNIYTAKKDTAGKTLGYVKFSYPNCEGTPVSYSFKDEDFVVNEMKVESAPGFGESPYEISYLELAELTVPE